MESLLTNAALQAAGAEPLSWRGGYTLTRLVTADMPVRPVAHDEDNEGNPFSQVASELKAFNRVDAVASELDIARFRLLAEQPDLHNEVDRLRGEGQFKLAVAAPLLAVSVALAVSELSPAVAAVAVVLAVAVIGLMAWQGLDRLEDSGDRVADAIRAGKVTIPALEGTERETSTVVAGESIDSG